MLLKLSEHIAECHRRAERAKLERDRAMRDDGLTMEKPRRLGWTQELGLLALIRRGVRVVTASGDDMTDTSDPSRIMMRQIAGSFAQYEKARLVAKLKAARDRKKAESGKCGGRKTYAEARPAVVELVKELARQRIAYRKISAELARQGHLTGGGKPYAASAIQTMLGR